MIGPSNLLKPVNKKSQWPCDAMRGWIGIGTTRYRSLFAGRMWPDTARIGDVRKRLGLANYSSTIGHRDAGRLRVSIHR